MTNMTADEIIAQAKRNLGLNQPKVTPINGHAKQPDRELQIIEASSIMPRPTKWIWPGFLAAKSQTLLTGNPGLGKSQFISAVVASATTDKPFPGQAQAIHKPMNVLMIGEEDSLAETTIPRLMAAGADMDRVKFLNAVFRKGKNDTRYTVSEDSDLLAQAIRKMNIGLITVDPITGFLGTTDSYKASDVRHSLRPLCAAAEATGVCFLTLTHPSKSVAGHAINAFVGSQAFVALCRVGLLAVEEVEFNEEGEGKPTGRYLITNVKNNLAEKPSPIAYTIEATTVYGENDEGDKVEIPTSRLNFIHEKIEMTADEALDRANAKPVRPAPSLQKAQAFLKSFLGTEDKPQKVVEEAAEAQFIARATLRRACSSLVLPRKVGFGDDGHWVWSLKVLTD